MLNLSRLTSLKILILWGIMPENGKVWDEIVEKHGLYKTKLEEITCPAAAKTVTFWVPPCFVA